MGWWRRIRGWWNGEQSVYCLMERQEGGAQLLHGVYMSRALAHQGMAMWAQRYDVEEGKHYAYIREMTTNTHSPLLRRLPGRVSQDAQARVERVLRRER